jgi:hypothetical protein
MKIFSAMLCAGLLIAIPALAAPGDVKSSGATWNVSAADSLNPAIVVDLVMAPPKRVLADKDALAVAKQFLKGHKTLKGCAVSGTPQPEAWALSPVWVVYLSCK